MCALAPFIQLFPAPSPAPTKEKCGKMLRSPVPDSFIGSCAECHLFDDRDRHRYVGSQGEPGVRREDSGARRTGARADLAHACGGASGLPQPRIVVVRGDVLHAEHGDGGHGGVLHRYRALKVCDSKQPIFFKPPPPSMKSMIAFQSHPLTRLCASTAAPA